MSSKNRVCDSQAASFAAPFGVPRRKGIVSEGGPRRRGRRLFTIRQKKKCTGVFRLAPALPLEPAAARAMLDETHGDAGKSETDNNTYTFGSMAGHNCVIACLPAGVYGQTSATIVASYMGSSFPSIRFWLLVGIGGGAPTEKADIGLGDVVVSTPTSQTQSPGVVQYDYGKMIGDGVFERTGILNKPPQLLLNAVSTLQAQHRTDGCSGILELINEMTSKHPDMRARYGPRDPRSDVLFKADYDHGKRDNCQNCDRRSVKNGKNLQGRRQLPMPKNCWASFHQHLRRHLVSSIGNCVWRR